MEKAIELSVNENKQVIVTSNNVASMFGKLHKHVVRDIENLDCSEEFSRSNFGLTSYVDSRGKIQKSYQMTKDGFSFLAFGYRGAKAAEFKERYIRAFNDMEERIRSSKSPADKMFSYSLDKVNESFNLALNKVADKFLEFQEKQNDFYLKQTQMLTNKIADVIQFPAKPIAESKQQLSFNIDSVSDELISLSEFGNKHGFSSLLDQKLRTKISARAKKERINHVTKMVPINQFPESWLISVIKKMV